MTKPVPPPDPQRPAGPSVGMPLFGTVPLGPDEPELFTDAMERILDHLLGGRQSPRHRAT